VSQGPYPPRGVHSTPLPPRPPQGLPAVMPRFRRTLPVAVLLLAAAWPAPAASFQPPKEPEPSPEEKLTRALIATPVTFPSYVFEGEKFPAPVLALPAEVEKATGPATVSAQYFDPVGAQRDEAPFPGPYFAVVKVAFKGWT